MSIYYIERSNGDIYELDATVRVSYQESGKLTTYTVEDGDFASDNYVHSPKMFMAAGSISDIKPSATSPERIKSTEEFIDGLKGIKQNKETFVFHFGTKVGEFRNCMFKDVKIEQNPTRGSVDDLDSFSVSLRFSQVRFTHQAEVVPFRDPLANDKYQDRADGAGTSEEPEGIKLDELQRATLEAQGFDPDEVLTQIEAGEET